MPNIQGAGRSGSGEASLPGLQTAPPLCAPGPFLGACVWGEGQRVPVSLFIPPPVPLDQGLTL